MAENDKILDLEVLDEEIENYRIYHAMQNIDNNYENQSASSIGVSR